MSDSLTFQRAKMVHFWFILSIVSGLAAPSFYPPPNIISVIINAVVTQLPTF